MRAGKLGEKGNLWLKEPLDELWVGSTARVFKGILDGNFYAVKIIRPECLAKDLVQFETEARIMPQLNDRPWITKLYELGYMRCPGGQLLPPDPDYVPGSVERIWGVYSARYLKGEIYRYQVADTKDWMDNLKLKASRGWWPYFVFEFRDCLPTSERSIPTEQYLDQLFPPQIRKHWPEKKFQMLVNILLSVCLVYNDIHQQGILYNDPKLAHFGWSEIDRNLFVIDWNFSKMTGSRLTNQMVAEDLQKLGRWVFSPLLLGTDFQGENNQVATLQKISQQLLNWEFSDALALHGQLKKLL